MPISFTRLKISGFKSFANTTSLDILPGLTGIVGPNGCGKSNIVEAIRWVMGESSARSLRGEGMDDVIFAGTARRTAFNIGEVTLTLEKIKDKTEAEPKEIIPPCFQNQNQIEISRQIERDSGSQYRLNGKIQRARDIQTLFADLGSGPRSTAIISQNRISQLISATPEERRQVLEEAAGISGLHNRRREAELKLKATEENLFRLNDLKEQLEDLTNTLREQSSQASIYRTLSTSLRQEENHLQAFYFLRAQANLKSLQKQIITTQTTVSEKNNQIQEFETVLNNIQQEASTLSQKESQVRIYLDQQRQHVVRLKNELEQTNREIKQLNERLAEAETHSVSLQIHIDKNLEDQHILEEELKENTKILDHHPVQKAEIEQVIHRFEEKKNHLNQKIKNTEQELSTIYQKNLVITQKFEQVREQKEKLESEYERLFSEYQECLSNLPTSEALQKKQEAISTAHNKVNEIESRRQILKTKIQAAELEITKQTYHAQQTEKNYNALLHNIEQAKTRIKQLEQENHRLTQENNTLQKQNFPIHEQQQCKETIKQSQSALTHLTDEIETLRLEYQTAIELRLEQESLYHQSLQTYEQRKNQLKEAQNDWEQAQETYETLKKQLEILSKQSIEPDVLNQKQALYDEIKTRLSNQHIIIHTLEAEIETNNSALEHQNLIYQHHENQLHHQIAKQEGLKQILLDHKEDQQSQSLPAILDPLSIPKEWVTVIGAIFDDTIEAPIGKNQIRGWVQLETIQSKSHFPTHLTKLSDIVKAPPLLQRAFDQIGIVQSCEEGNRLFPTLLPGQILATKAGDIWRWDGYYQSHTRQNKAAQRFIQHHNLQQIEKELLRLHQKTPEIQEQLDQFKTKQIELKNQWIKAKEICKDLEKQEHNLANDFFSLQNKAQAIQTQCKAIHPSYDQAKKNVQQKKETLERLQNESDDSVPSKENMQRTLQDEQQKKLVIQQKQNELKTVEHDLACLNDQYQQRFNQDVQNKIKLETLQEKLNVCHHNLEQQRQFMSDNQQQLQQAQKPDALFKRIEQIKTDLEQRNAELNQDHERYCQAEEILKQAQHDFQTLKERAIQQKSRLEILSSHYQKRENDLKELSILFQEAELNLNNRIDCKELEENLKKLLQDYQLCKTETEQKRLNYHLAIQENENLITQNQNLRQQLKKWHDYTEERQAEKDQTTQKINDLRYQCETNRQKLDQLQSQLAEHQEKEQSTASIYLEAQKNTIELNQKKQDIEQDLQNLAVQKNELSENLIKIKTKEEQAEIVFMQLNTDLTEEIKGFITQNPELDLKDHTEKKLKASLKSLKETREALGAVNLRAEIEYQEKQKELSRLEHELTELTAATQQLRESIHKLNQQGKSKLNAIFKKVDQHFQDLFIRMFQGGQAYLKLLHHEDPLQSGLEIYVQPPGKKLSTLSLLSGGEQALTTLSLVFAVSRCNPVPICILDEVDAPLDDPNVERFCKLLSDMTEQAGTRFLVVTHHQLTMSHMHRLYGVTMQERGVSQLISIDLENAVRIQHDKNHEQLEFDQKKLIKKSTARVT